MCACEKIQRGRIDIAEKLIELAQRERNTAAVHGGSVGRRRRHLRTPGPAKESNVIRSRSSSCIRRRVVFLLVQ